MQKNVDDFCPLFSQNLPESFELLKRKFGKISQNDGNEIVYGTTVCTTSCRNYCCKPKAMMTTNTPMLHLDLLYILDKTKQTRSIQKLYMYNKGWGPFLLAIAIVKRWQLWLLWGEIYMYCIVDVVCIVKN